LTFVVNTARSLYYDSATTSTSSPYLYSPVARVGQNFPVSLEKSPVGLKGPAVVIFPEDKTMIRTPFRMKVSARLLSFSYLKYLAHDPTFLL